MGGVKRGIGEWRNGEEEERGLRSVVTNYEGIGLAEMKEKGGVV